MWSPCVASIERTIKGLNFALRYSLLDGLAETARHMKNCMIEQYIHNKYMA